MHIATTPVPDCAASIMNTSLDLLRFIRRTVQRERPGGLSLQHFRSLSAIRGGMAQTPSELAAYLELSPGAATKQVDQLSGAGLVTRSLDGADGRRRRLALTRAGERTIATATTATTARLNERLETLDEAQRQLVFEAMELLQQALRP
jgi:DNA-binding MarR family transcriptional regulator